MTTEHRGPLNTSGVFALAWRNTGGLQATRRSADLALSVIVWILCFNYWLHHPWWDQVISVLPNVLGFTLGGFAIFLGFGSDSFKKVLVDENHAKSLYLSVSSAFLVFVSMQIFSLLYAFVAKALHFELPKSLIGIQPLISFGEPIASGIGYFLFVYSFVLALRAAVRVFKLSRWYNDFLIDEEDRKNDWRD